MNSQNGNYMGNPQWYNNGNQQTPFGNNSSFMPQQSPLQPLTYQQQNIKRIPARIISDVQEITPNEVPMDGSVSLFPTSDFTCIYAKAWNANGTIDTVKYIPEASPTKTNNSSEELYSVIMGRLDNIEKILTKKNQFNGKQFTKKENESSVKS